GPDRQCRVQHQPGRACRPAACGDGPVIYSGGDRGRDASALGVLTALSESRRAAIILDALNRGALRGLGDTAAAEPGVLREPPLAGPLADPCAERHQVQVGDDESRLDVFLTGTVFMDVIFTGLPGPPVPGTEILTSGLGSAPGGVANLAVALS